MTMAAIMPGFRTSQRGVSHRGRRCPSALALSIAVLLAIALRVPALAAGTVPPPQGAEVLSFVQRDLNGDSRPDLAVITASYHSQRYRIEVYDRGRDMNWADTWQAGTDFVDDVWVFKSEADNVTRLIIRFDHDDTGYTASLFDDVDGNGVVSYQMPAPSQLRITESPFPTVKLESREYWILPTGQPNRNVHVTSYRPMTSGTDEESQFQDRLFHDGRPALEQEVVDTGGDSAPDYELVRGYYNVPDTWNVFRTFLLVNIDHRPLAGFRDYFFWPFLGYANGNDKQRSADFWRIGPEDGVENTTPPIQVDWAHSKIQGVGHFLPLWGLGDQWRLQSWAPLKKGETNQLDWERFAYYSFTGNANPDMVVRLRQGYPTTTVRSGNKDLHLENVAMSWKYQNPGTLYWDFKLDMAGLHELPTSTVTFSDFSLREVPFAQYPAYYADRGWAYATFVAAEGPFSLSNEGIGEWATLHGVHTNDDLPIEQNIIPRSESGQFHYLAGDSPVSPATYYSRIKQGLRGEYSDLNGQIPRLYMSAIDHKLHLLHAQFGIWNLGDGREIHYSNLGGDYLNQWDLLNGSQLLATLRYISGQLVLNAPNSVRIIPAKINEPAFTSAPPRNQQEWAALGDRLVRPASGSKADDLSGLAEQFGGSGMTIVGANLRNFRSTGNGFRFVLTLSPGFTVDGPDLLAVGSVLPGDYVVSYAGSFSVQAATPPRLTLSVARDPADAPDTVINQPSSLLAVVGNAGSMDAAASVRLRQISASRTLSWSEPQTVTVRPGQSVPVRFGWIPDSTGDWRLQAEARLLTDQGIAANPATAQSQIFVRSALETSPTQDITAFGLVAGWQWGLLLGSMLVVGAVLGWRVFASLEELPASRIPTGSTEGEDR